MVGVGGQFAAQPERANVGRVLKAGATRMEGFVGNGQRILTRLHRRFPHAKKVLAHQGSRSEATILDKEGVGHGVAVVLALCFSFGRSAQPAPEEKGGPAWRARPPWTRGW